MNVRNIVFFSMVLYSTVSLVAMGRAKDSIRLMVKSVADRNLKRARTDCMRPELSIKEIFNGNRGSIEVSQGNGCPAVLYTPYLCNNHVTNLAVTAAFYMRSRNKQYASLLCHNDISKLQAHVEDSLKEGIETCTRDGEILEQVTAIHAVPDLLDQRFLKRQEKYMSTWGSEEKDKQSLIMRESVRHSEHLLKMMKLAVSAIPQRYDLSGRLIAKCYGHWNTDGFEFLIDPCQKRSYYQLLPLACEEKEGCLYRPEPLYEHQQVAVFRNGLVTSMRDGNFHK